MHCDCSISFPVMTLWRHQSLCDSSQAISQIQWNVRCGWIIYETLKLMLLIIIYTSDLNIYNACTIYVTLYLQHAS